MNMWAVVFTVLYFGTIDVHTAPEPKDDKVFNITMTMVKIGVINMDVNAVCRAAGYVTPAELAAYTTTTEESVTKKTKSDSGKGSEPTYTIVEETTTDKPGSTKTTEPDTTNTSKEATTDKPGSTKTTEPDTTATSKEATTGTPVNTKTTSDMLTSKPESAGTTEVASTSTVGNTITTNDTSTEEETTITDGSTLSIKDSRTAATRTPRATTGTSEGPVHTTMSSGFSPTKIDGVSTTTTVTDGPTTSFGSTDEVTTSTTAGDTLSTTDSSIPIAVAYKTGAKTQSDKSTTSSTTLTSEEPRPSSVADKSTTLAEPTTENSFVTPLTTIKEEAITPDTTITPKKITTITPKAITTEESKPTTLTDSVSTTTERTSADKLGSGHEINYSVYGYLALSLLLAAIVIWISYMIYTRHQANSYVLPPPAPEATPLNHITTAA